MSTYGGGDYYIKHMHTHTGSSDDLYSTEVLTQTDRLHAL